MCWQLFIEHFETDFMKNTSADIININTIKHTWMRFSFKCNMALALFRMFQSRILRKDIILFVCRNSLYKSYREYICCYELYKSHISYKKKAFHQIVLSYVS